MPLPPDVKDELQRAAQTEREIREREQARQRAEDEAIDAELRAERRAQRGAVKHAEVILAWVKEEAAPAARELGTKLFLIDDDGRNGHRGWLWVDQRGVLEMDRRTGPAWGIRGVIDSPRKLTEGFYAGILVELAKHIRGGTIWEHVRTIAVKREAEARRHAARAEGEG